MLASAGTCVEELEFFKQLFEFAPDATVVSGRGCIVHVNARVETRFGYHREALQRESIEVLLPGCFHEQHGKQCMPRLGLFIGARMEAIFGRCDAESVGQGTRLASSLPP